MMNPNGDQSPLRILFILGRGVLGGVERHVQAIIRNLDRRRFTPVVLILFEGGPVAEELNRMGAEVEILGGKSGWQPGLALKLIGALRRLKPDVVHAHELHSVIGLALRLLPSIPWIQTEHCSMDHGPSPGRARLLWRLFNGRMNLILTVSRATGDVLHRHTGIERPRIQTLFNGVELSGLPVKDPQYLRREFGWSERDCLIGAVGRLAWQKGWDDFLKTAGHLAESHSERRFVIVGDGPERTQLEERAKGHSWSDRCHFLGGRSDALSIIGGLDLFILASRHEELPTTLLEAFALRTPVVGFLPEGGVAEVLEFSSASPARLISDRDPAHLAAIADELLDDPSARERMVHSGGEVVAHHFSMEKITRALEDHYLRMARRGARS